IAREKDCEHIERAQIAQAVQIPDAAMPQEDHDDGHDRDGNEPEAAEEARAHQDRAERVEGAAPAALRLIRFGALARARAPVDGCRAKRASAAASPRKAFRSIGAATPRLRALL